MHVVPPSNLLAFVVAAIVLIVIPGPSVLFTIGRALALGRRGGLLSVLGNALLLGLSIYALAVLLVALDHTRPNPVRHRAHHPRKNRISSPATGGLK